MPQPNVTAAPGRALARFGRAQLALLHAREGEVLLTLAREAAGLVGAAWAEVRSPVDGLPPLAGYRDPAAPVRGTPLTSSATELRVNDELIGILVIGDRHLEYADPDPHRVRSGELLEALCASAACRLGQARPAEMGSRRLLAGQPDGTSGPSSAPVGVVFTACRGDGEWIVRSANSAVTQLFGHETESVQGRPLTAVLGDEIDPQALSREVSDGPAARRLRRADGTRFEAWIFSVPVEGADISGYAVAILDVQRQTRRQHELERIAMTDQVTGLANRIHVTNLLEHCLGADRPRSVAVMLLDLDRFKNVNDSLGHQTGDQLLIEVARRLRRAVGEETVVARLGGDEFLLLIRGLDDVLDVHPMAYELLGELASPYQLESGHRVATSVSIGVAIADQDGIGAGELIRRADLAMYSAKDLGGNRYALCDAGMLAAAENRLNREVVLRRGLDEGRLELWLQPIVDLRTGRVKEFEALVRLLDPDLGEVQPASFVPIAEETGLIAQIDHWVLEASLALLARDERFVNDPEVRIAVNISGRTLERPDFMSRLVVALQRNNVKASRLAIEITESCLLGDNRAILWTLNQLRARGAHVAIDDFGTGYSALSYLQHFEVDLLKIDQSFVRRVSHRDERGTRLVRSIVQLAHEMGLMVVAEGVEEPEQAELLRQLSCDLGQGWLYGRPVPASSYRLTPNGSPGLIQPQRVPTQDDLSADGLPSTA